MKNYLLLSFMIIIFAGCSKQPSIKEGDLFIKTSFDSLPKWQEQDHKTNLLLFIDECKNTKTKEIYGTLCQKASQTQNAEEFFTKNFTPFKVLSSKDGSDEGLLTGYYEPTLNGSLTKKEPYIYPIYETPEDLLIIDLADEYSELKGYNLRGKLQGNKIVAYDDREAIDQKGLDAKIICFVDSKIDLFFLEVQGSGVVKLDNGESMYIGYHNQNGRKYTSIGKYLIDKNHLKKETISMQSIKEFLLNNPNMIDKVLHQNRSKIFFKQKTTPAVGAMGVVLKPNISIAVDTKFTKLGSFLYLSAKDEGFEKDSLVVAQDRGGAIKGSLRADLFMGSDELGAGKLKAKLSMFLLLPNGVEP
ncbi:MAG: murein transglycosylase A [Sulfurimonadaceae bacterium]|jgi:membrane-bound lytic murein transglycosylase A|nr:murein transglycosylase A [Sulfurimonadaceae bacterium]